MDSSQMPGHSDLETDVEPAAQNAFARSNSCAALGITMARFRQIHGFGSSFSATWNESEGGAELDLGFFGPAIPDNATDWAELLLLSERMAFLQQVIAELEARNAPPELVEHFSDEALEVAVKLRPNDEGKLRAAAEHAREQEREARALRTGG